MPATTCKGGTIRALGAVANHFLCMFECDHLPNLYRRQDLDLSMVHVEARSCTGLVDVCEEMRCGIRARMSGSDFCLTSRKSLKARVAAVAASVLVESGTRATHGEHGLMPDHDTLRLASGARLHKDQ